MSRSDGQEGKLRLVSYNIRKAVGLDWKRHPHRILDVLNALQSDVVLLQEADRRLGPRRSAIPKYLIEAETDLVPVDLAVNDVSLGWHGNAILVRRGIEVAGIDRIELPGLEPRGAVLSRLVTPAGAVVVVGVHLALLRRWRRLQLATIRSRLTKEDKSRSVVAGDFNEWSAAAGTEALEWTHSVITPGHTFHASSPRAGLDKFALGQLVTLVDCGVDEFASGQEKLRSSADLD